MKTINTTYINKIELEKYIYDNNVKSHKNILLQIFTGNCNKEFINDLVAFIVSLVPHIKIIGSTTDGEIIDGKISSLNTILSFSFFRSTTIDIYRTNENENSFLMAKSLIDKANNIENAKVGITFTSGLDTNGEYYLDGFNQFAPNLIISGGLSADNAKFEHTYVFTHYGVEDNVAVIALLFSDNLTVTRTYSFGWEIIGKEFTITKSIENRVYTIDNYTPVDLYKKYLGKSISDQLPKTGIEFPLIIKQDNNKLARAVLKKYDDGSLLFAGNVNEGDKVYFGYGNIDHILNNIHYTFDEINIKPIESIFIYSCMARKRLLGKDIEIELAPLAKFAPMSGFFSYGEFFSPPNSKKQLFNETMTLLGLSENKIVVKKEKVTHNVLSHSSSTVEALSHLVAQSTKELNDLNNTLELKVKQQVAELLKRDQLLEQQSKLALMGEMISMIAHQWRQPLNVIGAINMKIETKLDFDKPLTSETYAPISEDINRQLTFMSKTIDDFRSFFHNNKIKATTNYTKLVNLALGIIGASVKNNYIDIILDLQCTTNILTYESELTQVILNLIKNAEDALLDRKIENPYIKIRSYKNDDKAILDIIDNGGGVDPKIIEKIFNPYFSTKLKKHGTGLGLYMSKIIVEEHCQGSICVYNNKNETIFRIILKQDLD